MTTIQIDLYDVACLSCLGKIRRGIKKFNGVENVKIVSGSGIVQINFNENIIPTKEIKRNITKLAMRTFD